MEARQSDVPTSAAPAAPAAAAPAGVSQPTSSSTTNPPPAFASWIVTGISGITLISVLGGIFAAGIWKGSIDTQLQLAAERQKQLIDEQKETRQKVEDLKVALSELKGELGHSTPTPERGRERAGE